MAFNVPPKYQRAVVGHVSPREEVSAEPKGFVLGVYHTQRAYVGFQVFDLPNDIKSFLEEKVFVAHPVIRIGEKDFADGDKEIAVELMEMTFGK